MEENGIQASRKRALPKKLLYLMFLLVVILLPQFSLCTAVPENANESQQEAYNRAVKVIEGMLDCVRKVDEEDTYSYKPRPVPINSESDCFKRTLFSGMGDLLRHAYTTEMDNVRHQKEVDQLNERYEKTAEQNIELEEKLEIATGEKVSLQNQIQEKEKAIENLTKENLRLLREHVIIVENKTLETASLKTNLENCYSEKKVLEEGLSNFKLNLTEDIKNGLEVKQEFDELKNSTACQDNDSLEIGRIKTLINRGADIRAKDGKGNTALHRLVKNGTNLRACQFHAFAQFLISKNLSSILNTKGEFTREYNTSTSHKYGFNMKDSTPLQLAVKNLEVENRTLTLLKENDADFNSVDGKGHNVLHYAIVGHRSVELLSQLVGVGANWKYTNPFKYNWSLLHYAVVFGTIEQIKFVVDLGLDINIRDTSAYTPLHEATCGRSKNLLQVVQFLIENLADAKARTKQGRTPFDLLADCDNPSSDREKVTELLT